MDIKAVVGILIASKKPTVLAAFYKEKLGVSLLADADHGPAGAHYHGVIGKTFIGILPEQWVGAPVVASFAVADVKEAVGLLRGRGVPIVGEPMDIGEGKRVASIRDPERNVLRLVDFRGE